MFNSIRWSLQLWHAGLLAVVLSVFGISAYYGISHGHYNEADIELERTIQMLIAGLHFPPPPGPPMFRMNESPNDPRNNHEEQQRHRPGPPDRPKSFARTDGPKNDVNENWPPFNPRNYLDWLKGMEVPAVVAQRFGNGESGSIYYAMWDPDGTLLKTSLAAKDMPDPILHLSDGNAKSSDDETKREGQKPIPPENDDEAAWSDFFKNTKIELPNATPPKIRQRGEMREVYVSGPFGIHFLVGKSIQPLKADLRRLAWMLVATGTSVLVIGLAGGWFLSTRAVRPIKAITIAAQEISASNLSHRIDTGGTKSELGTLALVLNDAFARLEAAFKQQVRFTADASHELRTPLAVIHTNVQLALSRERTAAEYRKIIETCFRASTRMKSLVDSLLILAKADVGRLSLDRGLFDLSDIVRDCIHMVSQLAEEKGIEIDADLHPAEVTADPSRIAQVATNLLTNAIRYNHRGGRVHVSVEGKADCVTLTIADTGIGIPEENQPHVFERFYRIDQARGREDGGSGLGLAICKSIVESHVGTILFSSTPGSGTTFTVQLPCTEADKLTPNN